MHRNRLAQIRVGDKPKIPLSISIIMLGPNRAELATNGGRSVTLASSHLGALIGVVLLQWGVADGTPYFFQLQDGRQSAGSCHQYTRSARALAPEVVEKLLTGVIENA